MILAVPPDPATGDVPSRPVLPVEPSARTYTLADLISRVRAGQVRVPHFQRGLRWTKSDAAALVDSVLRGFPIGSLLLWKRHGPAQEIKLGDVSISAPEMDEALYVVDGQQRITAFLNAFDPEAGMYGQFALVYDLKEAPFRVRVRRAAEHDSIPLPTLFDLGRLLRWARENPQYLEQIDVINEATTRLREFHVPAYEVRSDDDLALRDIYDRMNNAGKRLSRAEAFWGLFAPDEGAADDLMSLSTLQEHVANALHWGRIDDDTILRVFLARRGYDVTRDIHQEFDDERRQQTDFPGEDKQQAYLQALEALEHSVNFLRDTAGVPHFTFLAFRYLLVVLTRFFAHFPEPDPRNLELLRRWYWRAALVGPSVAKGSATGAMRLLAACVRPTDESGSVQALLRSVEDKPWQLPDVYRFRSNYSATHVMLCALWDLGPLNPDTGEVFTYADLSEQIGGSSTPNSACPELVPRTSLPIDLQSAIGNRVIMPGVPLEVVQRLFLPLDLFSEASPGSLRSSHVLFDQADAPTSAVETSGWVRKRTDELRGRINDYLVRMAGQGLDDAPPLSELEHEEPGDDEEPVTDSW